MRSLEKPFEQVNSEQLIRRIYNWVSPIDSVNPAVDELRSDRCEFLDFFVRKPGGADGLPGTLETTWRIDGEVSGSGGFPDVGQLRAACRLASYRSRGAGHDLGGPAGPR